MSISDEYVQTHAPFGLASGKFIKNYNMRRVQSRICAKKK